MSPVNNFKNFLKFYVFDTYLHGIFRRLWLSRVTSPFLTLPTHKKTFKQPLQIKCTPNIPRAMYVNDCTLIKTYTVTV